jgi:molybdate transport system regulatory protein
LAEKKINSVIDRAYSLRGQTVTKPKPEIRVHAWLETREGLLFGVGRAELLDKIEELGSLRKAAEEMCMSYRAAWGKIKKTEEVLGFKLIEKEHGNKIGFRLTEAGKALKRNYRDWYQAVETEALRKARELFPWTMTIPGKRSASSRIPEEAANKC